MVSKTEQPVDLQEDLDALICRAKQEPGVTELLAILETAQDDAYSTLPTAPEIRFVGSTSTVVE